MKKIKFAVYHKDRVVCVSVSGVHRFYFQPCTSRERLYLFEKDHSPSIYSFFKDYGICLNGSGYSMTLKQIYEHRKMYRNHKLKEVFDRLPGIIDYVLRENAEKEERVKHNNTLKNADKVIYEDFDRAA